MGALLLLSDAAGGGPPPVNEVTERITLFAAATSGLKLLPSFGTVEHFLAATQLTLWETAPQGLQIMSPAASSGNTPSPDTFVECAPERTSIGARRLRTSR